MDSNITNDRKSTITNDRESTITVTGKGWVSLTPDITRLTITNEMVLPDYNTAFQRSTENNQKFQQCLKECNINAKKLRTITFDIDKHFEYEYDKYDHQKKVFKGYKLTQKMRIDLGMDNEVLTKVITAIGKAVREDLEIEIGYTVKDMRDANIRMLEKAVADATEKAEVITKAAYCVLDGVERIRYADDPTEVYFQARNIHNSAEALNSSSDSLDITPCEVGAGKNVNVTWYIRQMSAEEKESAIAEKEIKKFDLNRFKLAQESKYYKALEEIKAGKKETNWIWYIFPQLKGLGHSYNSEYYGIADGNEAKAYAQDPVLGERLREITATLLQHSKGKSIPITNIFNSIDAAKVKSCMTLFEAITHEPIFIQVLDTMYGGNRDKAILTKLSK